MNCFQLDKTPFFLLYYPMSSMFYFLLSILLNVRPTWRNPRVFPWTGPRVGACSFWVGFRLPRVDEHSCLHSPMGNEAEGRPWRQPLLRPRQPGGWGCWQGCHYANGILLWSQNQWPLGGSKNSWRTIWSLCYQFEGMWRLYLAPLIDFILRSHREQWSKHQRPCSFNRNLRRGSALEVVVECRGSDFGLWRHCLNSHLSLWLSWLVGQGDFTSLLPLPHL